MGVTSRPGNNGASDGLRFLEEVYRHDGRALSLGHRLRKIRAMLALEISEMHFAFVLANCLLAPFPRIVGRRLRPAVYRRLGFRIGRRTMISRPWALDGLGRPYGRLTIGDDCSITGVRFHLNESVRIGNRVNIAEGTTISTDKHEVGGLDRRMGHIRSRPITIGDGVWIQRDVKLIAANVGAGAIVGLNAVVTRDVPPNTLVAGVPARVVKELPAGDGSLSTASQHADQPSTSVEASRFDSTHDE